MILGIDAGGTHTRFILFDDKGEILNKQTLDTMHFMKVGYEGIRQRLLEYKEMMDSQGYETDSFKVAIGIAGYGQDSIIRENIELKVHSVFKEAKIYNDAEFALISALENKDGVFVISGTGSIALSRINDEISRAGGFGYLLDDAGSAFWIGKKILEVFVRQTDGREQMTELHGFILGKLKMTNPYEIIQKVHLENENYRNFVASLAYITKDLDDTLLFSIYSKAGEELAQLANVFNPDVDTKISVGGSVLLKNKKVLQSFKKHLNKNFEFVEAIHPVEYAAYLIYR